MEWQDSGIVIKSRPHGEGKAVVTIFTQNHGRHLGYIRGTRKLSAVLQSGVIVDCRWKARLQDQLGSWDLEMRTPVQPIILEDPIVLSALLSMCSWVDLTLAEREPHPYLYQAFLDCLNKLAIFGSIADYVRYELDLLKDLGFGLDLTKCAVTNSDQNLMYVSPRTGRVVCESAGQPYADRLLSLPLFLKENFETVSFQDIIGGLNLTGYFLERFVLTQHNKAMPLARQRLLGLVKKRANEYGQGSLSRCATE